MLKWAEMTAARLNALVLMAAVVFLVVMAAIVVINVATRYLFHLSLTWSAELARYCMVWSAMLAAAILVNQKKHLAVDLLERALPAAQRRRLHLLIALLCTTFYAAVLISGIMFVARTSGQVAASIEALPMNLVYAIIPISAALMFVGGVIDALRAWNADESYL